MRVIDREAIEAVLPNLDLVAAAEQAFLLISAGRAVLPPVGELLFEDPPGDVHLKYGYLRGESDYVVKIASGFYGNPTLGLPSSNGLILVFSQRTGVLQAILLDEGILTDHRTAAAGACVARALSPSAVRRIGILGTGTQAALQLRYLAGVVNCREVLVRGRSRDSAEAFRERMRGTGFAIEVAESADVVAEQCELIVTATPAREPLLHRLPPGRHVTAVGSDTPDKQELAPAILGAADVVVVDSVAQSQARGEVFRAAQDGGFDPARAVELGRVLAGDHPGRTDDLQLTVADLTGVATQDITIASAVCAALAANGRRH